MTVSSVPPPLLHAPEAASPPTAGSVALRPLDWDTAFFGVRMGTLVLTPSHPHLDPTGLAGQIEADLRHALARARDEGYAHLIFRVGADQLPVAWAAERAGLRLVDLGVDSSFALDSTPLPAPPDTPTRDVRLDDVPALRELAADAFLLSRFSADPFFSAEQVRDFHREWARNLCAGLAQGVLICELDGAIAGFVSCAVNGAEGRIPLIATRAGYRRRGLGRGLVSAALRWFAKAGVSTAHVKTQAHNYPALALYHRAGFVVSKTELTFSITLRAADPR